MVNTKSFIKITNKDIYNKICELKETNAKEHKEIIEHLFRTNGKVKLNKWIATTALSLTISTIITILVCLMKGVL